MRPHLLVFTVALSPSMVAAKPLDVVASFSILADMVEQVGGDQVDVTSLVGPGGDAHVYEPTPSDVVAVSGADLVVVNGLGFEGFMSRLIEASETQAPIVTATSGIDVLETASHDSDHHDDDDDHDGHDHASQDDHSHDDHGHDDHAHGDQDDHGHDDHAHDDHDHGPEDPHAWQSLNAAQIYVENIAHSLCDISSENCALFEANAASYVDQLNELEAKWRAAIDLIPQDQRIVITSHDAFSYLARDFDLEMLTVQGVSTNSEASAADVAALIDEIRTTGAKALFVENISDPRLLEQIAEETGLTVSGTLYSGALEADGMASTYLGMMEANLHAISEALLATN
jgi:zinc/manganese transport system substrate-binding protein